MEREASVGMASPPGAARRGSGLAPRRAAALSYLFGPFTGALFLWLDEDDPLVRFHALQAVVLTVAWVVAWLGALLVAAILGVIPLLGPTLSVFIRFLVAAGGFGLWCVALVRAGLGEPWAIPLLGPIVRRLEAIADEDAVREERVGQE